MLILPRRSICTNLRDWYKPLTPFSWTWSANNATKFRLFSHTHRQPSNANTATTYFALPLVAAPSSLSVAHGEEREIESDLQAHWCYLDLSTTMSATEDSSMEWDQWTPTATVKPPPTAGQLCLGREARPKGFAIFTRLGVSHDKEHWPNNGPETKEILGNGRQSQKSRC